LKLSGGGFHCSFLGDCGFKKVRTTHIADKDEIACDQRHRLVCPASQISNQIAQVLWRMAGRVNHLDADLANHELIAVLEKMCVRSPSRPPVSPIRSTRAGKVKMNVRVLRELPRSANKVCVDMGLRDRANTKPIGLGESSISVDVAFGINYQRLLRLLAAQ
jgi:hypothetical protein